MLVRFGWWWRGAGFSELTWAMYATTCGTGSRRALVSRREAARSSSGWWRSVAARHCDGSAAVAGVLPVGAQRGDRGSGRFASLEWRLWVRSHPFVGAAIACLFACRMATIVGNFFYGFFLGAVYDPSTRNWSRADVDRGAAHHPKRSGSCAPEPHQDPENGSRRRPGARGAGIIRS